MKHSPSTLTTIIVLFLLSAGVGQSQKQSEAQWIEEELTGFVLIGGTMNVVEGNVTAERGGADPRPLKPKQQLANGDEVQIGESGHAEILLNPGYYLRITQNTRIAFLDLSRENLKLKLLNGSAIFEVLEVSDQSRTFGPSVPLELLTAIYPSITIATPQAEIVIVSGGIYRLDVGTNEVHLKVTRGLAFVAGNRLRNGSEATFRGGSTTLTKFEKTSTDAFDNWSSERAGLLVDSNKALRHTQWSKQLRNNSQRYFRIEDEGRSQTAREQHTVSAIGGLVNFSEGAASVARGDAGWEALAVGQGLQYGDKVRTGEDGRIEILLYPTCYLHLSSGAEIVYAERQGGGVVIRLLKGSALVTSIAEEKDEAPVTLAGPGAQYDIEKKGMYRLNVMPPDRSEMIVYEGQLTFAGGKIKEGKKAVTQVNETAIVSIDKKALDSLDVWSRKRTVSLAATTSWVRYMSSHFKRERVFTNGMWFYDRWFRTYTFVPGLWDFSSPYGGDYSVKFRGRRY